MTLHFLNGVANDAESIQKVLKCETMGNRTLGSRLFTCISSLPGSVLITHVECQQAFSKPCLVNLMHVSKDTYLVFSLYDVDATI